MFRKVSSSLMVLLNLFLYTNLCNAEVSMSTSVKLERSQHSDLSPVINVSLHRDESLRACITGYNNSYNRGITWTLIHNGEPIKVGYLKPHSVLAFSEDLTEGSYSVALACGDGFGCSGGLSFEIGAK